MRCLRGNVIFNFFAFRHLRLKNVRDSFKSDRFCCNWKGEPSSWAGLLPSPEMVASGRVHASLALLRLRVPSFFISSFVHSNLPLWTKILSDSPVQTAFPRYLECGVDVHDIFSSVSRVPFKVKFIASILWLPPIMSREIWLAGLFLSPPLTLVSSTWGKCFFARYIQ